MTAQHVRTLTFACLRNLLPADCSTSADAFTLFNKVERPGLVTRGADAHGKQRNAVLIPPATPNAYPWDERCRLLRNRGSSVRGDEIFTAVRLTHSRAARSYPKLVAVALHNDDAYLEAAAAAIAAHNAAGADGEAWIQVLSWQQHVRTMR